MPYWLALARICLLWVRVNRQQTGGMRLVVQDQWLGQIGFEGEVDFQPLLLSLVSSGLNTRPVWSKVHLLQSQRLPIGANHEGFEEFIPGFRFQVMNHQIVCFTIHADVKVAWMAPA